MTMQQSDLPRPGMLYLTVGLPGSGKTTLALAWIADGGQRTRVNRDDLRAMMFGGWTGEHAHEDAVTVVQHAAVARLLAAGWDVVVDDTNLRAEHRDALAALAAEAGTDVVVWDLTGVPVDECVRRDAARAAAGQRSVGEAVIRRMAAG